MANTSTGNSTARDVRLDTAHIVVEHSEDTSLEALRDSEATSIDSSQMHNQASQLAVHLQEMRADVDRREAELNAREATAEKEMRSARLWLQQREQELIDRAEVLDQRECALSDAEAKISKTLSEHELATADEDELSEKVREALEQLRAQREAQDEELQQQRRQIDLRRRASVALVEQLLEGAERRRASVEQEYERRQKEIRAIQKQAFQQDYEEAVEQFTARQKYLDDAEAMLANGLADLEVQQQQLKMQRQHTESQLRELRTQLADRQQELELQWQQRQEAVARRNEQLNSREAGIEQTRREVSATHREALELRLATEELWVKFSNIAPAPALTTELGRIRRRLAESYCLERNAAIQEKQQLAAAHKRLADQYVKLNAEKKELHDWVTRREQDIEQQAARLVAREQELNLQDIEHAEMLQQWEGDRRNYEEKIRSLTKDLRRPPEKKELAAV
jgi:hypothetical protein